MAERTSIRYFSVAIMGLTSVACSPAPLTWESLALTAIAPDSAVVGESVAAEITGQNFVVPIQISLGSDRLELAPIAVNLGGKALAGVILESSTRITAQIPSDLPGGRHDLELTIVDHGSAELAKAFEVLAPIIAELTAPQELALGEMANFTLNVSSRSPGPVEIELGGSVSSEPPSILATGEIQLEPNLAPGETSQATAWIREVGGNLVAQNVTLTVPVRWIYGDLAGTINATAQIELLAQKACTTAAQCQDPCHSAAACTDGYCDFGPADKDSDHDGAIDSACGGDDCDDQNDSAFPGQNWFADCDGDGVFGSAGNSSCPAPSGVCADAQAPDGGWSHTAGNDCDDENPAVLTARVWYADTDADTYGDPNANMLSCDQPSGYVANADDCDDAGPCADACSPGLIEASAEGNCDDGADNDCDGAADVADLDCDSANTPPVPVLAVTPPAGDPTTQFFADASSSWDREDSDPNNLTFDWDWQNDGAFDHLDDPTPTTSFGYTSAGTYTVVLRVTDSGGLQSYGLFVVVVTASVDEQITVTNGSDTGPGSFAAAIDEANSSGGRQTVFIPPGTEVAISSQIVLTDPVDIIGDGATLISDGTIGDCLVPLSGSDGSGLYGFEIKGCSGAGLRAQQTGNHTISRCYFHHNQLGLSLQSANNTVGPNNVIASHTGSGIVLKAANLVVRGNSIRDNQEAGISVLSAGSGAIIERNSFWNNTKGCDLGSSANGVLIRHNTFFANAEGIVANVNVVDTDCRNNLLSHHTTLGVSGNNGNFSPGQFDYNAFFANGAGSDHCSGCSDLGAHSLVDQNPLFVNTALPDLRLLPASPLVDQGLDVGVDMNGLLPVPPYPPPELYNGTAPEIGAWEAP